MPVGALLSGGLVLGVLGDALLRVSGPPGVNLFLWIASIGVAALALQARAGGGLDRERAVWLIVAMMFPAGLAWRDADVLKLLALGCATVAFALAAYRPAAAWVRSAGVARYVLAWGMGALHAWTATAYTLLEAARSSARADSTRGPGWRHATAVVRGLIIAAPLVLLFGALFMSADAVFADLVLGIVRFDFEWVAGHVLLFGITAWISTGYLRGFLAGTEPPLRAVWRNAVAHDLVPRRPVLSITEIATALAAIDLLFLLFVLVQFRYLFGGDALIQVTPDLTYAEYARRGFFELVFAVFLVVPVLLAADWLAGRRSGRGHVVFRSLAGVQIALVLAITASAFQRLRLYHESYGLTESRFYAMVLLIWIGAMLLWLAATVLRGRRRSFAFGALTSGLATVALLFVNSPDAIIARTNVTRMESAEAAVRFDVVYATSLSADAVPVLIAALPSLPSDVQCPLARHMLRRWAPEREQPLRAWNWSASRARDAVRAHEATLRSMVGPDQECATPAA